MRKVIFLDRDGTLIDNKHYLNDVESIEYLPGMFEALQWLKSVGYEFVMVTNQSGIPRGLITEEQLTAIHEQMAKDFQAKGLEFLDIYFAPHLPETDHEDRKPNPGMLEKARKKHDINMEHSWMIGDSSADTGAGHNAGVPTIYLDMQPGVAPPDQAKYVADSWPAVTTIIASVSN